MAARRADIRMSAAEVVDFISTQERVAVVAVEDGQPVATIGSAELVGDGWQITLDAEDEVARLLAIDDRVCVLVDQFPTYYEIKGIAAHGRAQRQSRDGSKFTFTLVLDDVTSFDFAKIPDKARNT